MSDKRNKINILQRQPNQDGSIRDDYGEPIDNWVPITPYKIWASKEPILGREFFTALTTENKVEVKFRTHYFKGVTSDMRVEDDEGVYEIIGLPINVKSLNRELLLYCKKVC